jgi:hypothetical protein
MSAWLAFLLAGVAAQPAPPPLRAELEPLRFLVGHCWRGAMKQGAEQDTHCFEPAYGGQHVRDRHEVTGAAAPYSGETLYSWNGVEKRIDYVYFNSLGGVSRGSMMPRPGLLDFGGDTYTGADGTRMSISIIWRMIDERTYEAVTTSSANPTGQRVVRFTRLD